MRYTGLGVGHKNTRECTQQFEQEIKEATDVEEDESLWIDDDEVGETQGEVDDDVAVEVEIEVEEPHDETDDESDVDNVDLEDLAGEQSEDEDVDFDESYF